ncbi:MAG TPA: DM13 domain-containing protein [Solirubrobacteraceae bacterium]|nr:DM13 domain-containing protein [Solirubrobacteraceae bacterium]
MSGRRLAILVAIGLVAGIWLLSAVVAPGYVSAILLALAWLLIVGIFVGRVTTVNPSLSRVVGGTYLACAVILLAAFYWTCIRASEVDEKIATAPPASRALSGIAAADEDNKLIPPPDSTTQLIGPLKAVAPTAKGTARVVQLANDDLVLTLSGGFDVSPAPGTKVRLATSEDGARYKELGDLKGSKGKQQYDVPEDVPLSVYDTLVLYCAPFSQVIATAELTPA